MTEVNGGEWRVEPGEEVVGQPKECSECGAATSINDWDHVRDPNISCTACHWWRYLTATGYSEWPGLYHTSEKKEYLWVNLCDLGDLGGVGGLGSPLLFMIVEELGDHLMPGCYYHPKKLDDMFVIVESFEKRLSAIIGGLNLVARKKIGRHIRMRHTKNMPGKAWRYVPEKGINNVSKCYIPAHRGE